MWLTEQVNPSVENVEWNNSCGDVLNTSATMLFYVASELDFINLGETVIGYIFNAGSINSWNKVKNLNKTKCFKIWNKLSFYLYYKMSSLFLKITWLLSHIFTKQQAFVYVANYFTLLYIIKYYQCIQRRNIGILKLIADKDFKLRINIFIFEIVTLNFL